MFPAIRHIDDVLPHIAGCDEILVANRGNHTVINYMVDTGSTFFHDDPLTQAIRRECRGLIFNEDGIIIRRPLHKFFNFNQNEEMLVDSIDFREPHVILEKLDGSSLSPFWLFGEGDTVGALTIDNLFMGTRMGSTDVAAPVDAFVAANRNYFEFMRHCDNFNLTPIFEWCSRVQRIVIDHPEDRLVLLAIREMITGNYRTPGQQQLLADSFGIENVKTVDLDSFIGADIATAVNGLPMAEYGEGVVVRFYNGLWGKAKTEEYCRLHHAKERITEERHVMADILDGVIDDVLAEQQEDDRVRITKYQAKFWEGLAAYVATLMATINDRHEQFPNRKDYALSAVNKRDSKFTQRAVFWFYQEPLTYPVLREYVIKNLVRVNLGTRTKCKEMKNEVFHSLRFD